MYGIQTIKGKYAVKALNPQIMLRPTALTNYIESEQIANIASNYIPALPAKIFDGSSIQEIETQFYLVFDWIDGRSLKPGELSNAHSEKIGAILADIHMMDFSELGINNPSADEGLIDWNFLLEKGFECNAPWIEQFQNSIGKLYDLNIQAIKSAQLLSSAQVISHRDLDRQKCYLE